MAEYSSSSPGNEGADVHTPNETHEQDMWNFVTVLNVPSVNDEDDVRRSLKRSFESEDEEHISRTRVYVSQPSSLLEERRYATATVKTKQSGKAPLPLLPDVEISVGTKTKPLCLFSERCQAMFNISPPILEDAVVWKNLQQQAKQLDVSISATSSRVKVKGSCHQVNKFREYLSSQCLSIVLAGDPDIPQKISQSAKVKSAGMEPVELVPSVAEGDVSGTLDPSNATSSSEPSNGFSNFSPDVLKLLLKLKDIPGLKCFPDEGRIEVISADENEREKVISSFQEAYQRIVQNPQFKTGTLELPPTVRAEDVAVVLDQYNTKYHQCVFTYNATLHSIGIITMSSRQFDQAKKLLKERLTGEATATPTSSGNHYDSKSIKTFTISPGRVLTLKRGDMVKEQADVLVNAANKQLKHWGGLAQALDKASNWELQTHCNILTAKHGDIPTGEVALTAAGGKLMCRYVLHAVGPIASECRSDVECQELIYTAVTNSLKQASHLNAISIVLPALSTGIYSVNPILSAQAMLNAITSFVYKKDLLSDIRIVILDKQTYDSFADQMDRFAVPPDNPGPSSGTPHTLERSLSDQGTGHSFTGTGSVSGVGVTHDDSAIPGQPPSYSSVTGNTNESISNVHYPKLPLIGRPPGLVSANTPSTPGGNPTGTTAGGHSTPAGLSYSSPSSSEQPLLKPAVFTGPSSTSVLPSMMSHKAGNSTKVSGASSASSSDKPSDQKCPICLEPFKNPKTTECCKNLYCSGCLKKALEHSPYCPTCKTPLKQIKGNQPNGTMNSHTNQQLRLPGFRNCGTITIDYYFPSGTQKQNHPNPGQPYSGTTRTAYLPNNQEGRHVLKLLHRAFDAGLIFTIGTSTTSGKKNTVVWNDIHHKTSTHGGSTNYGYPDDTYLKRVQEELKTKGIY